MCTRLIKCPPHIGPSRMSWVCVYCEPMYVDGGHTEISAILGERNTSCGWCIKCLPKVVGFAQQRSRDKEFFVPRYYEDKLYNHMYEFLRAALPLKVEITPE